MRSTAANSTSKEGASSLISGYKILRERKVLPSPDPTAVLHSKGLSKAEKSRFRWWKRDFFCDNSINLKWYLAELGLTLADLPDLFDLEVEQDHRLDEDHSLDALLLPLLEAKPGDAAGLGLACRLLSSSIVNTMLREFRESQIMVPEELLLGFAYHLTGRIGAFLIPALVLEANLDAIRQVDNTQAAHSSLVSFTETFCAKSGREDFWRKYPVLLMKASATARAVSRSAQELFERVAADRHEIEFRFGIPVERPLTKVVWSIGDVHNGGQGVAILVFDGIRLVYKPRSMRAEVAYNKFLEWFGEKGCDLNPAVNQSLEKLTYGYSSYVEQKAVRTDLEATEFYRRAGMLLAISWLLGITDLHYENFIASGVDPFIVDVEAMFQKPTPAPGGARGFLGSSNTAFTSLLFGTGLLPAPALGETGVYDISGLGSVDIQPTPTRLPRVAFELGESPNVTLYEATMPAAHNVLIKGNSPCYPCQYEQPLLQGFEQAMNVFAVHKDELSRLLPLLFNSVETRFIPRQTRDYASMMTSMLHPSLSRSELDCEMYLGGRLTSAITENPYMMDLASDEREQIWAGDVPYFWTTPGDRTLHSTTGLLIPNFFTSDGITEGLNRLERLDLLRGPQQAAITSSLRSTLPLNLAFRSNNAPYEPSICRMNSTQLVSSAVDIWRQIDRSVLKVNGFPFAAGLSPLQEHKYAAGLLPADLYDGFPGIGIFLARLQRYHDSSVLRKRIRDVRRLTRVLLKSDVGLPSGGAFVGLGSLIYADLQMAVACNEAPSKESLAALKRIGPIVSDDESYDIVAGSAGLILVMLRYHAVTKEPKALEIANKAASHLADRAEHRENGVAWHTLKRHRERLGGMAHGVSGIGWALSEWGFQSGDKRWAQLSAQALDYEESLFDKEAGTWIDARHNSKTCFWCYGAPGIGLAIQEMKTSDQERTTRWLQLAKEATWRLGFSECNSLCHGNLGNAELFLLAGDVGMANAYLNHALDDVDRKGFWDCGLPGDATTPGLMCGLAGIGYALLRFADPSQVPSVLALRNE